MESVVSKSEEVIYVHVDSRYETKKFGEDKTCLDFKVDFKDFGKGIIRAGLNDICGSINIPNGCPEVCKRAFKIRVKKGVNTYTSPYIDFPLGYYVKSKTLLNLNGYIGFDDMMGSVLDFWLPKFTGLNVQGSCNYQAENDCFILGCYDKGTNKYLFLELFDINDKFGKIFLGITPNIAPNTGILPEKNVKLFIYNPEDKDKVYLVLTNPASFTYPTLYLQSDELTRWSNGGYHNNSKLIGSIFRIPLQVSFTAKLDYWFTYQISEPAMFNNEFSIPLNVIDFYISDEYGDKLAFTETFDSYDNYYSDMLEIYNGDKNYFDEVYDRNLVNDVYKCPFPGEQGNYITMTFKCINKMY